MLTVIYTSDMHGNVHQYRQLVAYALGTSADAVIIGGDLAPKGPLDSAATQRSFLLELPGLLAPLGGHAYLMLGNDDCAANMDVLQEEDGRTYHLIHGRRLPLGAYDVVGYSYVPITPFGIKDWERYDLSEVPTGLADAYAARKRTNYRLEGVKSTRTGWMDFTFYPEMEARDSIQRDLAHRDMVHDARRTIYVMHTPPDRTTLDRVLHGEHVGSFAVRLFIEQHQPYLTLHGHIHETVVVSGAFQERIGDTLCMSSGNHNVGRLTLLSFDLCEPSDAVRIQI